MQNGWQDVRKRIAIILLVGLSILIVVFLKLGGDSLNGLIPTGIGFCLEGLIFVGLLERYDRAHAAEESRRAEYLRKVVFDRILGDTLNWLSGWVYERHSLLEQVELLASGPVGPIFYHSAEKDGDSLRETELLPALRGNLSTMRSLMPTVAAVDPNLLDPWLRAICYLQAMVNAQTPERRRGYYFGFLVFTRACLKHTDTHLSAPSQASWAAAMKAYEAYTADEHDGHHDGDDGEHAKDRTADSE